VSEPPLFLAKHTVLEIHDQQIAEHGGDPALRDEGLLESALAQPQAGFGGQYLHEDLFAMAAAYLFHLANNHPFADGNKRTALGAAVLFLAANGYELIETRPGELADLVLEMVAEHRDKAWMAEQLRQRSHPSP
jgi:death on curing protein